MTDDKSHAAEVPETDPRGETTDEQTRIDITFETEYGKTASWSDINIIEFEIVDGTLRVYTDGEVSEHEIPLERLEHLAVSTAAGQGVHWSGYLKRHVTGSRYEVPTEDSDDD